VVNISGAFLGACSGIFVSEFVIILLFFAIIVLLTFAVLWPCSLDSKLLTPKSSDIRSAVVQSNGEVIWIPVMKFQTHCPLDLTHFPFDEHLCDIRIMSWSYDEAEVVLCCAWPPSLPHLAGGS